MKIKELRQKNDIELKKMLESSHDKLREDRFKVASRQMKNVRDIRATRKTVAQILTILKERKNK